MIHAFQKEFVRRIEEKYEEEKIKIFLWEAGKQEKDTITRTIIEQLNWKYYGKKLDILQGDFLLLEFPKEESFYFMELINVYICYQEEGWEETLNEIERYRKRKQRYKQQFENDGTLMEACWIEKMLRSAVHERKRSEKKLYGLTVI